MASRSGWRCCTCSWAAGGAPSWGTRRPMASAGLLFRGARVVDPAGGRDEVADVLVRGGVVADVGRGLDGASAGMIDGDGLVLSPGLVDMHTHLREPGFEQKETVETGTRWAPVRGHPGGPPQGNTEPVAD